jgi:hypothetical protein
VQNLHCSSIRRGVCAGYDICEERSARHTFLRRDWIRPNLTTTISNRSMCIDDENYRISLLPQVEVNTQMNSIIYIYHERRWYRQGETVRRNGQMSSTTWIEKSRDICTLDHISHHTLYLLKRDHPFNFSTLEPHSSLHLRPRIHRNLNL